MARPLRPETWGRSTVRTACPLDCPDSCTLDVTVERGRIVKIDGGDANPVTRDYICAKVRRFGERVYGEDRLLYPAIRKGPKGQGVFTRYAHLSSFAPDALVGARVVAGQQIGLMGNTAAYTIPIHLHYEVLLGDYDTPAQSFGLEARSPFALEAAR